MRVRNSEAGTAVVLAQGVYVAESDVTVEETNVLPDGRKLVKTELVPKGCSVSVTEQSGRRWFSLLAGDEMLTPKEAVLVRL